MLLLLHDYLIKNPFRLSKKRKPSFLFIAAFSFYWHFYEGQRTGFLKIKKPPTNVGGCNQYKTKLLFYQLFGNGSIFTFNM